MSESAEEKTKRGFLKTYRESFWPIQTTVFLSDYSHRLNGLAIFRQMRRRLPRMYPETAILWRIILSDIPEYGVHNLLNYAGPESVSVTMPALTLFTYDRVPQLELVDELEGYLPKHFGGEIIPLDVRQRTVSTRRYHRSMKKILRDKPHDLKHYFGLEQHPQRYGVLAANHAVKLTDRLDDESGY